MFKGKPKHATALPYTVAQAKAECAKAGEILYSEIAEIRPTWKFLVAYELAPHFVQMSNTNVVVAGIRLERIKELSVLTVKRVRFGRLSLIRSTNRNSTNIQCLHTGDDAITPEAIVSLPMIYTLLKAQPLQQKLLYLQKHGFVEAHDDNLIALQRCIVSDIIEEQFALRRVEWSGKLLDCNLLEHCPTLCAFAQFAIEEYFATDNSMLPSLRQTLVGIACLCLYTIKRWTRWYDWMMLHRRWRSLRHECCSLLERVISVLDKDKRMNIILLNLSKEYGKKDLEELLKDMSTGPAGTRSSGNDELIFRVIEYKELVGFRLRERPPRVVEDRWCMENSRERKLALHKLQMDFKQSDGLIKQKTTREERHERMDFLNCAGNHSATELRMRVDDPCSICGEPMALSYNDVLQNGGMSCSKCRWFVCYACWYQGNNARWNPQVDFVTESV
jgi:hypothetical protein